MHFIVMVCHIMSYTSLSWYLYWVQWHSHCFDFFVIHTQSLVRSAAKSYSLDVYMKVCSSPLADELLNNKECVQSTSLKHNQFGQLHTFGFSSDSLHLISLFRCTAQRNRLALCHSKVKVKVERNAWLRRHSHSGGLRIMNHGNMALVTYSIT